MQRSFPGNAPPWFVVAMGLVLFQTPTAWAACPDGTTRFDLDQALDAGRTSFRSGDLLKYGTARMKAFAALDCLVEPLEPGDAGMFHLVIAGGAWLEQEDDVALVALRSAYAIDGWLPPDDFAPEGSGFNSIVDAAREAGAGGTRGILVPAHGQITVDGTQTEFAPVDRPAILQEILFDGAIRRTYYLQADAPLPGWADPANAPPPPPPKTVEAPPVPVAPKVKVPHAPRRGLRLFLVTASAASAVTSAATWVTARSRHDAFVDPTTDYTDLDRLDHENAVYSYTALGTGIATLGLATTCVLTW